MFVGREKEAKQIMASLSSGRNVILSGTYGMGRTSLVRHVAQVMKGEREFLFADYSETPARVCRALESLSNEGTTCRKKTVPLRYRSRRRRPAARQELLDIIETLSTALRPLLKAYENRQE
jgi:replication-associated recombination protein RarA